MIDILLSGASGKMGRVIASLVEARNDCRIAAGVDISTEPYSKFPIYSAPALCREHADVIIDFSHPSCLAGLLSHAKEKNIPCVVATTGLGTEQIEAVKSASRTIPVFFTANMSLGVNLLAQLAKTAAAVLGHDFDIEIIEKHHNQKLDAPSGTALLLADSISDALPRAPQYVYDRHSKRQKRQKDEIGIHSVRGGAIVGEHEVLFAGTDEVLTLSHAATSKQVFAVGAINAALFLSRQPAGCYDMGSLVAASSQNPE